MLLFLLCYFVILLAHFYQSKLFVLLYIIHHQQYLPWVYVYIIYTCSDQVCIILWSVAMKQIQIVAKFQELSNNQSISTCGSLLVDKTESDYDNKNCYYYRQLVYTRKSHKNTCWTNLATFTCTVEPPITDPPRSRIPDSGQEPCSQRPLSIQNDI